MQYIILVASSCFNYVGVKMYVSLHNNWAFLIERVTIVRADVDNTQITHVRHGLLLVYRAHSNDTVKPLTETGR